MSSPINATALPGQTQSGPAATTNPVAVKRWSRQVAVDIVAFSDITAVAIGALLPAWIYGTFGGLAFNWTLALQSALVGGFIAYLWLRNAGMYDTNKLHDLPYSPTHLFTALAVSVAAVVGLVVPLGQLHWHVIVWYSAWLSASFTLILASRGIAHAVLKRMTSAGRFDRNVAVFGAGLISRRVHDQLQNGDAGIHFIGVFDDRCGEERLNSEGLEVAGKLDDLLDAAYRQSVDDIIIALPQVADGRIAGIVRKLDKAPCNVHVVTHIASDIIDTNRLHRVSQMGAIGMLDVKEKPLSDWGPLVKRAEDLVVSSLGILIALPVLLFAIVAIRLESQGPAFYRQRRRGLNRQVFDVLKLRTLNRNDSDEQVRQVVPGDDRVTRVGRILRRTSIDELPQLWNVLKGEMSVVGPRPHALVHDDQFSELLEEYANRHQVKPGITGLAQIKGLRGQTQTVDKIKARVDQDMAYVKNWSLWLDIQIIAKTMWIVIGGKNAH